MDEFSPASAEEILAVADSLDPFVRKGPPDNITTMMAAALLRRFAAEFQGSENND